MFGRGCLELVDGIRSMGLSLVTAEKAIWSVRKIKTAYELEQKKKAFAIVNHAFDKTFQDASSNMSKDDLIRSMKCNLLNFGAETCDLGSATVYGRGTYQPDRNVHFEDGDYFFYDCYAYYNRYPADRERCIRVGEPTYEQIKDYSDVRNLTIEICKNIRAGMVAKDVFAIFEKLSRENGIGPFQTGTGRIGHDSGMEIVEPNCSITKDSEDPVLPGMIIHIEPKLKKHGGVYLFEEVVYVKPDGIEFVSELSPEECPIIPVQ